jgi:hypothetical protein
MAAEDHMSEVYWRLVEDYTVCKVYSSGVRYLGYMVGHKA